MIKNNIKYEKFIKEIAGVILNNKKPIINNLMLKDKCILNYKNIFKITIEKIK